MDQTDLFARFWSTFAKQYELQRCGDICRSVRDEVDTMRNADVLAGIAKKSGRSKF